MNEQEKKPIIGHIESRPDGSRVFVITEDNRNKGIHSFDSEVEKKKEVKNKIDIKKYKPNFMKKGL